MRQPTATIIVRPLPAFRFDAFAGGLEANGFRVNTKARRIPLAGDVLLIWNRMDTTERIVAAHRDAGAAVIVTENGYLGREWAGRFWYALSLDHHNGAGRWPQATDMPAEEYGARWDRQGVELAPWRADGGDIVILAQRGIGHREVKQPSQWPYLALRGLVGRTKRRVRLRPHPGERRRGKPLEDDLAGAWAVATWGSGAALKALTLGYPVFYQFRRWIGAPAGSPIDETNLEAPLSPDRLEMFRRMIWAQAPLDEIGNGEAIRRLMALEANLVRSPDLPDIGA